MKFNPRRSCGCGECILRQAGRRHFPAVPVGRGREAVEPTAWAITVVEVVLAIGLVVGWQLRWMALGTALLLAAFGVAIAATAGPKAALDATIFPAAAAAFLLSAQGKGA